MKTRESADILHLGCGEDYHNDAWNVDANPDVNPDAVYNLDELPWPWQSESWDTIRAFHLFEHLEDIEAALRESQRLLQPGGHLILKLPIGNDALADPDHTWGNGFPWTWRTPEFYTGKRHWDIDVGLQVVNRRVDIWSHAPTIWRRGVYKLLWGWRMQRHGPGEWCFNHGGVSGEFTIVFQKP